MAVMPESARRRTQVIQEVPQVQIVQEVQEVVRNVVEEKVTAVPKVITTQQVVLQQTAKAEVIEKYVEVPQYEVTTTTEEVLIPLVQERVLEIPEVMVTECIRHV